MTVSIRPGTAKGTVCAPKSKSAAHRLLLCAGLANGTSTIRELPLNKDTEATMASLRSLGAGITLSGNAALVTGCDPRSRKDPAVLPCHESGSTLRFLIPLCLLSDAPAKLTGTEKLLSRPLSEYESVFSKQGIRLLREKTSLTVEGKLSGGTYTLRGDVSSQFVTGLLYALPLAEEDSLIRLIPPVESRPYIDLTLSHLGAAGIRAEWTDDTALFVPGGQNYLPVDAVVEGDWSNAAFLEGLNLLGGSVTVTGLAEGSPQGDKVCREYFRKLEDGTPVLDLSDCPDLGPVLFALAAAKNGASFTGVSRLRDKESDRIGAMQEELAKFGIRTEAGIGTFTVFPGYRAPSGPICGYNDHRVVMALAVLCTVTGGTILGAEAVSKSFPDFFEKLSELGVEIDAVDQ